jgi:hypothetical protein
MKRTPIIVPPRNEGTVPRITRKEVRKAMRKMKNGKVTGPDGLPVEAWKCFGEQGIGWLQAIFNSVLEKGKMPDDWRGSIIVPIYKNKGDVQDCGNYRGIKLTSHTLKIWERVIDVRLRTMVHI